jgi:hypothetical protein
LVLVQTSLHFILFTHALVNSNRFTAHVPKSNFSNAFLLILILKNAYVVITTESVQLPTRGNLAADGYSFFFGKKNQPKQETINVAFTTYINLHCHYVGTSKFTEPPMGLSILIESKSYSVTINKLLFRWIISTVFVLT